MGDILQTSSCTQLVSMPPSPELRFTLDIILAGRSAPRSSSLTRSASALADLTILETVDSKPC